MAKRWRVGLFSLGIAAGLLWAQPQGPPAREGRSIAGPIERLFRGLPEIRHHYAEGPQAPADERPLTADGRRRESQAARERRNYQQILREKLAGRWFAALASTSPDNLNEIQGRFDSWKGLLDFILAREAVVELWAYGDGGTRNARRVPAFEVAEMARRPQEQPLFVTLTYRDPESGTILTQRVEFGFGAAQAALRAQQAYAEQRKLQLEARRILATHTPEGKFSALAQWNALRSAVRQGGLVVGQMPPKPLATNDLFVAVEYEVDKANFFARIAQFWRESEVLPHVVHEPDGRYVQQLLLKRWGEKRGREVRAFRIKIQGAGEELEPVSSPILGQDSIELRVVNPNVPDPRQWNVLEFGEPALIRQAATAEFSLVNAYFDKHRKEVALTRSKFDLFAEPVFAGLNIGCGLAGVPFPVGEAARLGYNAAITPWLIPAVPNVKQMRDLMRLVAAREKIPGLKTRPARFLDEADFKRLKRQAATISDAELDAFLQRIREEDILAMVRLAKMAHLDDEITNLLNILAGAAKVSGWSDDPGFQRDVLNSIYFSVNGDINIKNIIAVLAGARDATPYAGVSLHDLAHGEGPTIAWLQYLDVTVDVRAVANTISWVMHSGLANKELKMPFPYATRMTDIAAYEIRIFGYPLFMYYKRGLLKDDYAAYQNDYAYGLITTRIVEHFRTREEMEKEIRAGRMMPLGFVRVPSLEGGWKESNLAVFAHRIPTGKYKGKTSIIIYGLKAYSEQSRLMQREYERLKKFEQALQQGGVIEQVVGTDGRGNSGASTSASAAASQPSVPWLLPDPGLEPEIHVGTNASAELFSPLLGNLLEWRRFLLRSAWGLAVSASETNLLDRVRRALAAQGVSLEPRAGDPLLWVDRFSSSFLYRKRINGRMCTVKMVSIPAPQEILREVRKAEEAQVVEEACHRGLSAGGHGVALLSSIRWVKDPLAHSSTLVPEVGALLRDRAGQVGDAGVITDPIALDRLFDQISRLPVIERARLKARDFAASVVDLDVDGTGRKQKVFLTVEFPVGQQFERVITNLQTGEAALHTYEDGRLVRTVGKRTIVELEYTNDVEVASRTFLNRGTLRKPVKGPVIEETRTLEVWHRDLRDGRIDPYQPVISKLRANFITGVVQREDFGQFSQPVSTADDLYVVSNRYNPYGIFASARIWENIGGESGQGMTAPGTDAEGQEATSQRAAGDDFVPLERVLAPVAGLPRYKVTSAVPPADLERTTDARGTGYKTVVRKLDLLKGISRLQTFDNAFGGRLVSESWTDPLVEQTRFPWFAGQTVEAPETWDFTAWVPDFAGPPAPLPPLPSVLKVVVSSDYEDDFYFGLVPCATRKVVGQRTEVQQTRTLSYDPLTRRLAALERDYTGVSRTNVWDYRWDSPVLVESSGRRTEIRYNREETAQTSRTFITSSGEQLSTASGEFDPNRGCWRIQRTWWYRPGVMNRAVTETRSGFGLLLASRTADVYLAQPAYDSTGIEQSTRVFRRNPVSGRFDILHRTEDDFVWQEGRRTAEVQTYVDGRPYDRFRILTDSFGRTTEDGIREYPGLRLLTRISYEGDSERVARAEDLLNGKIRTTRLPQREQAAAANGGLRWELPVTVVPAWGLVSTQLFVLGDPLGRPILTRLENGDRVQVREWFPDTCIPHTSEVLKPDGRVVERAVASLNNGTNGGIPYDLLARYRLSFWGAAGLAAEEATVRGTDLAMFTDSADERTFFDLSQTFKAPQYAVDPHGYLGVSATVKGTRRRNVLALFRARLLGGGAGPEGSAATLREQQTQPLGRELLKIEKADLRGLFFHRITIRTFDRSGRLLDEVLSRAPTAGEECYRDETAFNTPGLTLAHFKPQYDPGWFVEGGADAGDPRQAGRWLSFTNQPPPAGTRGYRVNSGEFPDTITLTEGKVFGSTGESDAARFRDLFYRRIHTPRFLERNPYLPGVSDCWSASTRTDFGQDGSRLVDLELVFDAQGRLRVARAQKSTSSGAPGTRISYHVVGPQPEILKTSEFRPGRNSVKVSASGRTDFADSDFLYVYASGAAGAQLAITDGSGRTATVWAGDADFARGRVPEWRIHPMHVRWLPDDIDPRQGADLTAPTWLVRSGQLIPVSVQDLDRAGLDVRRLHSFALVFSNSEPVRLSLSAVHAADRCGEFVRDSNRRQYSVREFRHSNGLRTIVTTDRTRTEREFYTGQRTDTLIEFNGLPVATARARGPLAGFPHVLWLDNSDPDVARPLYAVSGLNGRFLEYYQMLRPGDTHLFVAPQSFEVPRLETYRAAVLHDELYPGHIGYGRDYSLSVPITRSGGLIGRIQATLRNRIEANLFNFAAGRALQILEPPAADQGVRRFNYRQFQDATNRAREITGQPCVAQALVSLRQLPWEGAVTGGTAGEGPSNPARDASSPLVAVNWSRLGVTLDLRHNGLNVAYPTTRLIPTSPETRAERFVDTVKEAGLIILAAKLGERRLAGELLEFYWNASGGGLQPLLASYDAQTGTGMEMDVRAKRPRQAEKTAEAQLAIAEAAFYLAFEASFRTNPSSSASFSSPAAAPGSLRGDTQWLSFGRNLLDVVLKHFRPAQAGPTGARGICEYWVYPVRPFMGLTIWPDANLYSMASNARGYRLLKQLRSMAGVRFQDPEWELELSAALGEQEKFLRQQVLPEVARTGVVPAGLFEVQDLEQKTSAIAVQRWTTADGWLALLDAAVDLGVPPATCREWLDNLARVHGVRVRDAWGLDWRVALLRPDAISTELTARFLRVARRLGDEPAAAFAAENLRKIERKVRSHEVELFPVAVTEASWDHALAGSKDFNILPWANLRAWPPSISIFCDLREAEEYGRGAGAQSAVVSARQSQPVSAFGSSTNEVRRAQGRLTALARGNPPSANRMASDSQRTDVTVFVLIAAGVYASILGSALFWWAIGGLRRRHRSDPFADALVPGRVMQRAEERWAKRVLGLRTTPTAENWRFSNAPVEQNFLVQLRAAYKLILEWRRLENGWAEDDERLVESAADVWLNGADEFAVLIGIYMRSVIKAGAKDGFPKPDVLQENEDSNHIWARLTLFFSEHLWSLSAAVGGWQKARGGPAQDDYRSEIEQTLGAMGVRQRLFAFDAREFFDYPASRDAMDLLIVQDPGRRLEDVLTEAGMRLDIPLEHIRKVIEQYKEFKKREQPYPIHPYLVEFAKELPHFMLMGLGAIIWYNQTIGDSPIVDYLKELLTTQLRQPQSLLWELPLLGGLVLAITARFSRVYRFAAAIRPRQKPSFLLDSTVTGIFVKRHEAEPKERTGPWHDPNAYERWGRVLRAFGWLVLAIELFRLETPSFGTFLIVKGIFAMLALAEVAAVMLPLGAGALSMFVQDRTVQRPGRGETNSPRGQKWLAFLNRLNITATRPASPIWLSIKYHAQPSMPTGTHWGLFQAIVFYFVLAASFFFGGIFLCQQVFPLWLTENYLQASNLKLIIGGFVFALTMILLRYGLFLLFTSLASLLVTFPLLSLAALTAVAQLVLTRSLGIDAAKFAPAFWGATALFVGFGLLRKRNRRRAPRGPTATAERQARPPQTGTEPRLAVVYMSGDDLSGLKLTPDLLMSRWGLLRDRLDSNVVPILNELAGKPDDETLRGWFQQLYEAETAAGVTLWHPVQLRLESEPESEGPDAWPELETGLRITVADPAQKQRLLAAWHIRRWLVCMMSTAGHSQDTGINLVDIALRFAQEGFSQQVAFYLIQNKYDNSSRNRPSQLAYDQGELGQRNKLARLLRAVAPGARAYCLQNWTPFGFKAGGLTGMDLVYEESLRLSCILVLDRNATVHDLNALMLDVRDAMSDPNLVIVIPGRSTTNTLTPVGQGSQLVEEGHRSYLRGLLALGGTASEAVGTGWGNLLACFYGRVQRALVSAGGQKMALTSRMQRGTSFAERTEGLIGFGPHAVGISEDIWAVVQAMNTALGLGLRPRFALSRAIWHKVRETWSQAEWLSSFPRWAGGYFQMAHDPLMQRIYDFGPQPVFARELRSNSGRNFLSAPIALLSILLMPLAIIFDVSPFVQTMVVLWNCGLILNQVLTLHALNTYLEGCGFYRLTALLGAVIGAALAWLVPGGRACAPGLVLLGFVVGGFLVGISRWLVTRVRDLILFGPQLVLHALAQTVRLSLEFTVSGTSAEDARHVNLGFRAWAGPREDRPLELFPGFLNLRTVIWGVGLFSLLLCVLALTRLDMLNVLLLLPSLLFSVSTLAGPFLMTPAAGKPLGIRTIIPRLSGWLAAAMFYVVVSVCAAHGRVGRWFALALFVLTFGLILRRALRYLTFRSKVRSGRQTLQQLIEAAISNSKVEEQGAAAHRPQSGVAAGGAGDSGKLCDLILQACLAGPGRVTAILDQANIIAKQQGPVMEFVENRMRPLLRGPSLDLKAGLLARSRWAVEYSRAFVLGLLVLLWFFLVPVPGLMVFTAGSYPERIRFTLPLLNILAVLGAGIGCALAVFWVGRVIQWLDLGGLGANGLRHRLQRCFAAIVRETKPRIKTPAQPGSGMEDASTGLTQAQSSSAFALVTDAQTYIDQRSCAYARRAVEDVESILQGPRTP